MKGKKKVTRRESYDALSVDATYPTGGRFRFSIGRSGERITFGGADGPEGKRQLAVLAEWTKCVGGETNGQRVDRLHAVLQRANSIGELVRLVEAGTVGVSRVE